MTGDSFWDLFWFPLVVLFAGMVDLIVGAWIPILLITFVWIIIYCAVKARKSLQ